MWGWQSKMVGPLSNNTNRSSLHRRSWLPLAVLLGFFSVIPSILRPCEATQGVGTEGSSKGLAVDIAADTIIYTPKSRIVDAKGRVKAQQGSLSLESHSARAILRPVPATPSKPVPPEVVPPSPGVQQGGGSPSLNHIDRLEARGAPGQPVITRDHAQGAVITSSHVEAYPEEKRVYFYPAQPDSPEGKISPKTASLSSHPYITLATPELRLTCTGSLLYDQKGSYARATGDVHVIMTADQATLQADELTVFFTRPEDSTTPSAPVATALDTSSHQQIREVTAAGNVRLTKGQQMATGQRALFRPSEHVIVLYDDVVLREEDSIIRGAYGTMNTQTGITRVMSQAPSQTPVHSSPSIKGGPGPGQVRAILRKKTTPTGPDALAQKSSMASSIGGLHDQRPSPTSPIPRDK